MSCEQWLFGIHQVMPQRVFELFTSWLGNFSRHHNIVLWKFVPHCIMCCIWWESNVRCFSLTAILIFFSYFLIYFIMPSKLHHVILKKRRSYTMSFLTRHRVTFSFSNKKCYNPWHVMMVRVQNNSCIYNATRTKRKMTLK